MEVFVRVLDSAEVAEVEVEEHEDCSKFLEKVLHTLDLEPEGVEVWFEGEEIKDVGDPLSGKGILPGDELVVKMSSKVLAARRLTEMGINYKKNQRWDNQITNPDVLRLFITAEVSFDVNNFLRTALGQNNIPVLEVLACLPWKQRWSNWYCITAKDIPSYSRSVAALEIVVAKLHTEFPNINLKTVKPNLCAALVRQYSLHPFSEILEMCSLLLDDEGLSPAGDCMATAISQPSMSILQFFVGKLRCKEEINTPNHEGVPPLHIAVQHNKPNMVRYLLEEGADINVVTKPVNHVGYETTGSTALYKAAQMGNTSLVELLCLEGADISMHDEYIGNTAIHEAASADVVKMLLEHGADIQSKNYRGETPLHRAACMKKHKGVCEALLQEGADPNAQNLYQQTPLHEACRMGIIDNIGCLLKHGASESIEDKNFVAPFTLASLNGHDPMLRTHIRYLYDKFSVQLNFDVITL